VVPVLVGEASLPPVDQLPDDLVSLVRRQAIELRDESWPEDVEMLLRRLEGKETVKARRRWIPVAIGLVALGVASALIWQAQDGGDNDDLTQCPAPEETWTVVDVAPNATDVEHLDRDRALRYTVESTDFRKESRDWLVVLHVRLDNESEDVPGNDDYTGYGPSVFDALHVNQISVGTPYCFGENSGDSNLAPGEAAVARVGFLSSFDPTGAALMLETDGPLFIEITPGT